MPTINHVIHQLSALSGPLTAHTVDTLKAGDETAEVRGIATVFMASHAILETAIERGLNLVITHEAPFYHHFDQIDILADDPIYLTKKALIEESGIAVFRWHDHIHRNAPDLVVEGLLRDLEWTPYVEAQESRMSLPLKTPPLAIPTMTLEEVARYVKRKLDVPFVRVVGDLAMPCTRVGLLPGYCGGGALAIPFFQGDELDLIITGEGPEWETPEYVRDAVSQGRTKALIVLGHSKSEESGMKYLADWVKPMFPDIRIEFIADPPLFRAV